MLKSTSIHNLNADKGLNKLQKVLYLFLNWVNNLFPYRNVDKRIKFKDFGELPWQAEWEHTYASSSPARKACDLFWRSLPWKQIESDLGEIHVFDTGCGHGNYSTRLQSGSRGRIKSYAGIDAKRRPNWSELEKENPRFKFIETTSNNILPLIPKETTLFVTQSAIEHFDDDLVFFEQIKKFIDTSGKPVMQIHLFPGAATLPLYLFHGLRQYTPRTISKITRLFPQAKFELYGLGGRESRKLHWKYFTWPVLITRKYTKPTFEVSQYEEELRAAVARDAKERVYSPLFWALIISPTDKND
jgi:hypothetical protein